MVESPTHLVAAVAVDDAGCIRRSLTQPDAFRDVFERHHERVRRYVVSRVGPQASDDVVADTFVAAFRARARFDAADGRDALPWLLGVATNVLARERVAQRRWLAQCAAEQARGAMPAPFEDDAVARTDAARRTRALAAAVRRLPAREREPLLLHVLGELSYEEIAASLDVPLGTVASRINRGRTRLAEWMEQQ